VTAAIAADVGRFVQLSTAKVYGNDPVGTISERSIPRPASHYAITHRASEDYAAQHSAAVVLRLANGFGAPAPGTQGGWDVIVNNFCRQAATARRIALRSDGTASRSFVPMDDVIRSIRSAVAGLAPGTYNLGARTAITLREMAELVAAIGERVLGYSSEVSVVAKQSNTRSRLLDFRSDRLRDAGVPLGADASEEIARTLVAAAGRFATCANE
jgi:nucleoside-diphosphate-sugar epimerase